jgi:hypothetical protein
VIFSAGALRPICTAALWLLILVLLVVPIASLVSKAGFVVVHEGGQRVQSWSLVKCLAEVAAAPREFRFEYQWTLITATGAAAITLLSPWPWPGRLAVAAGGAGGLVVISAAGGAVL